MDMRTMLKTRKTIQRLRAEALESNTTVGRLGMMDRMLAQLDRQIVQTG